MLQENVEKESLEEKEQEENQLGNTEQVSVPEEEILEGETEKKSIRKQILSFLGEMLFYAVIIVVCVYFIPKYVVQRTEVSGPSMENTLHDEENILVEKLSYRFQDPERFDIIVFYHFYDEEEDRNDEDSYDFYVKRIIGLPGETVQIADGTIYINGQPVEENYGKNPTDYSGVAEEPIVLGEDEFFVLGDNRAISQDSRYEEVGNVRKDQIVGKAWVRIYPFDKMGVLKK